MSTSHPYPPRRQAYEQNRLLFDSLRQRSISHLQSTLARVLGQADDWLFELHNKDSMVSGISPLDAMRQLRASRAAIERGFVQHFEQGFAGLLEQVVRSDHSGLELSLVEEDQLDGLLACEVLVDALTRIHGPALQALEQRLAAMVGVTELRSGQNPLTATSLASGLQSAQGTIALPDNLRVVLVKFYERELVGTLASLLTDLNATLVRAGILPELGNPEPTEAPVKPEPVKPKAEAPPRADPVRGWQPTQVDAAADDSEMFETLRNLLHRMRAQDAGSTAAEALANGRRALAVNEMMSVLSLMQPTVPQAVLDALTDSEASLSQLMKQEMLDSASRIGISPEQVHMAPEHEEAVDLVGMLFDVMFDERDFESEARTLISRLVVPFVKAAVIDRRLFQYKTHPARRLLNSLSEAVEGNKGDGPQERELLQKAESTVDRLIAEFNEDLAIFTTLEQELRAFIEQHHRRIELSERRAAETQRAQERLQQARSLATFELDLRIDGLSLPSTLVDFLSQSWTHHLSMLALRDRPGSPAWREALDVADTLIDHVPEPGHRASGTAALLEGLRKPIERILASSGITGDAIDAVLRDLQAGFTGDATSARAHEPPAPAMQEPGKPALHVVADKDRIDFDAHDLPPLRALKIGTWLDLAGADGKLSPAKLSWVSPISSRLMFVNRRGVRLLVASIEELAALKKQGQLVLREQQQVFDQALHRLRGRLESEVA